MTRSPPERADGRLPAWAGLALLLVIVVAVDLWLNPHRELLTWDDGWAYARSVRSLLATGRYTLDQWSAANMPVQIYLAAGAASLFGFSLTLLRLTTMALTVVLLASFRRLLRDRGAREDEALVLGLGLLASPVLLMLSFTFMSDVQFLAWLILALALYDRGLARRSIGLILAGSAAAACAVGTRQFGIAILAGWGCVWLLASRSERPRLALVLAALAAPAALAVWQMWVGSGQANFTQTYRLAEQRIFLSQPVRALIKEALWRSAIWAQYLALYLAPVQPLVIGACLRRARTADRSILLRAVLLTGLVMAAVAIGLRLNAHLTVRPPPVAGPAWPALGIIWMLPSQSWATVSVQKLLDMVGFLGIAPIAFLFLSGERLLPQRRPAPATVLTGGTGAALLAILMVYVQLNDTYFVTLVPFALLALQPALRAAPPARAWWGLAALLSLAILFTVTDLTRRSYDQQQISWDAADREAAAGKPYKRVAGPKHWAEYHGAFDDWIAAGAPGLQPPRRMLKVGEDPFHDPFYHWLQWRSYEALQRR